MKQKTPLLAALLLMTTMVTAATKELSIVTHNIQLVMQVKTDGRLYQTYLGQRLNSATPLDKLNMPMGTQNTSLFKGNEVYPVMGTEDYYEPALEIIHADGNTTSVLKYAAHETHAVDGGNETVIVLRDDIYPVEVKLHYVTYADDDIIRTWTEISHQEKGQVYLGRYASSMLYFENANYYLREFHGDWAKEMSLTDQQLVYGKKILDTRLGTRTAMYSQPFFQIGLGQAINENTGDVLMGTIGWTGNFRFTFEVDHNQELRVISGINPDASRYHLKRGEVFRTPDFVFTLSANGVGEGSRKFQHWMLNHQLYDGKKDRMTLLNNWENTAFRFDQDILSSLIDQTKDLGTDLFLLDDGWFGNKYPRNNDRQGLGDWQPMKKKLPDGIPFLVRKAQEAGVGFGIWIEPEMVSPKSELAEKHPDWIIQLPNRAPYYLRHQLVLDLTNPKVQDFVFGVVDHLMQENPELKFMKWDCNSPITNIYSPYEGKEQQNLYVDYVRGFYQVMERVRQTYPDLTLMLCASGGSRCDIEALKYFGEYWVSDDTDPIERLYIQWGASQFMPAKAMCAHVTDWNKSASIKFRTDVAFACKLGFDIDLKKLSAEELDYCKLAIKEYNRLKPVIFSPLLYRLVSPYETNHCVLQRISEDRSTSLLFAYDMRPRFRESLLPVKLQGLDPEAYYTVHEICLPTEKKSSLSAHGQTYTGDYLMKVGIQLLGSKEMVSHIIEINKQ